MIANSYHFERNGQNEQHNLVYTSYNGWTIGRGRNSDDNPSTLVGREFLITENAGVTVSALSNYDDGKGFGGWRPLVAGTYRIGFLKLFLAPRLAAVGLEHDF